jgi:AhpD family alkylhydroperoxidase
MSDHEPECFIPLAASLGHPCRVCAAVHAAYARGRADRDAEWQDVLAAAEQRGYTRGYNDKARAEQRTLIEYGGRP